MSIWLIDSDNNLSIIFFLFQTTECIYMHDLCLITPNAHILLMGKGDELFKQKPGCSIFFPITPILHQHFLMSCIILRLYRLRKSLIDKILDY